ncbi:MAG: RNA 3'-terminal phosphate cyclase, partial [Candidatus Woesearchaeota archaeon]
MKHELMILFAVLATLLLVVACTPKEAAKETVGETETAADKDVGNVESDISEVDVMTEETDISDLDNLDQDLADIENSSVMIKLDGSYGEGGGQIVRTALAFSTITQIPFEVNDIRRGREQPGLKAQHLTCVKALAKLCDAKAEGVELGSNAIKYWPGKIKGQTINIDIGTAGSITLLLQSLLLPCFFADKTVRLHLTGGTNVSWSMPIEYLEQVFIPHIAKYCEKIKIKLNKRG